MSDEGDLIIEERDQIAFVTFNRPEKLNAWTYAMSDELRNYLWSLNEGEYRIRCVVMTGSGRAFCSGADVGALAARQGGERPPWRPPHPEMHITEALRRCNAPVIAAINGYALGMGLGIAMSCDIRIAADDARFQVAQMKRGLTADTALAHSLPAAIGAERAMELMFTARMIEADEAERIGLVLKHRARRQPARRGRGAGARDREERPARRRRREAHRLPPRRRQLPARARLPRPDDGPAVPDRGRT